MSFGSGYLSKRIKVYNLEDATVGTHGEVKKGEYKLAKTIWAHIDYVKGKKAMREGALDAYAYLMVQTAWHQEINNASRFQIDGKMYQMDAPPHGDYQADEMQMTVFEIVGKK